MFFLKRRPTDDVGRGLLASDWYREGGPGVVARVGARTRAATAIPAAVPATRDPVRKRPRKGSQAALEMLHSCSARAASRAVTPATARPAEA